MAVLSTATDNDDIQPHNRAALSVIVQILAYAPLLVLVLYAYRKTKARCWSEWCDYEREEEPPPISDTVGYVAATENLNVGNHGNRLSDPWD